MLFSNLTLPVTIFIATFKLLGISADRNAICKGQAMTGKKRGAFNMDLDFPQIKEGCKAYGCTINEFTSAILS